MLNWLSAGESHGPALTGILEGMPAGIPVSTRALTQELARRRLGFGRSPRMAFEQDTIEILGGVRFGETIGSPIALVIHNTEWPAWRQAMAIEAPEDLEAIRQTGRGGRLTRPRPGHADLTGMVKYDRDDARDILERASARETAVRVGLGYFAKSLLAACGIQVVSHVRRIGGAALPEGYEALPVPGDQERIDESPVRCMDDATEAAMIRVIEQAKADLDTVGGEIEVVVYGLPPGLGSHVHWHRKLDGQLAQAIMSVQAFKAVGFGVGVEHGWTAGSRVHDEIVPSDSWVDNRRTVRNGGIEGGMSTGQPLRVHATMKPLASLLRPMPTIDVRTGEVVQAITQRSDICAVPRASVVLEAVVAMTLADALLTKTGGDSLGEVQRNLAGYVASIDRPRGLADGAMGADVQGDPVIGGAYMTPELTHADHRDGLLGQGSGGAVGEAARTPDQPEGGHGHE